MTKVRLCAVLLLLLGCATPGPPTADAPSPLRQHVEVRGSRFEPSLTLLGLEERFDYTYDVHFLRTMFTLATGAVTHQWYVRDYYADRDWRAYVQANGENAEQLEFMEIDRNVEDCYSGGRCSYREEFGVLLPDSLLRAETDGYAMKVYARSGYELVLTLTPAQIRAQLFTLDSLRAAR